MTADGIRLSVFVYGTLKRGQRNHDRFCADAVEIKAATTLGRLYDLPFGFPGLRFHEGSVHAVGSADYASDARRQHVRYTRPDAAPAGWDVVYGEVITFDDPEHLGALDALEEYTPGENGLYERVLVPVEADGEKVLAWAYQVKREIGVYLPGGRWPA